MTPVSLYNTASAHPVEKVGFTLDSVLPILSFDSSKVAAAFVRARRNAGFMEAYPGALPPDLASAYRCQDEAIALWADTIVGWKVGWIAEPSSVQFGAQRLVGPIFQRSLYSQSGPAPVRVGVFARGFAAVEAEFVFELAADAPSDQFDWSAESAGQLVKTMYVGIEIASSPLAHINDYGPAVVASDFGNNAGLLLGPEVHDWHSRPLEQLDCESLIDGASVGRGSAASVNGGPLAGLAFALRCNAQRGRPLRAGDYVTTGATTGVHGIATGQCAEAIFSGVGSLRCQAVPFE